MRPRVMRAIAVLLLLALVAAGGASSCGGNPTKERLSAYEATLEGPMAEDGRVSASLSELRKDLFEANAKAEDQMRYARETALPFFTRFRDEATAVATEDPPLERVHGNLLLYLNHRVDYLATIETCLAAAESDPMRRLAESMAVVQGARLALQQTSEGKVDAEVAEAFGVGQQFMEKIFVPFQQGQVEKGFVEQALGEQVLPRLARIAARPPGEAGGLPAVVVDWAKAEILFFETVGASLETQSTAQAALRASEEHWVRAEELRAAYLTGLGAYRESIR